MTTKQMARPQFDGAKLIALADTTWDLILLLREYAHDRATEAEFEQFAEQWQRQIASALVKPFSARKSLFAMVSSVQDDFHAIFANPSKRSRVLALTQKYIAVFGSAVVFTDDSPTTSLGGSNDPKVEA